MQCWYELPSALHKKPYLCSILWHTTTLQNVGKCIPLKSANTKAMCQYQILLLASISEAWCWFTSISYCWSSISLKYCQYTKLLCKNKNSNYFQKVINLIASRLHSWNLFVYNVKIIYFVTLEVNMCIIFFSILLKLYLLLGIIVWQATIILSLFLLIVSACLYSYIPSLTLNTLSYLLFQSFLHLCVN